MRSIKLKIRTMRFALMLLCLGLSLGGCGLFGGHGNLAAGARYQTEGKYRAAYIEAKKVLQRDDKNGAAWLLLGRSSLMLGNTSDALSDLENARANGVPASQWILPMGQALQVTGQYDKLLKVVSADAVTDPKTKAGVDVLRGNAYLGLKQLDEARQSYQDALALDPNAPRALVGLARISASSNDMESADKYVQQALAVAPQNPQAWIFKGDLALHKQDFAGAETDYMKVLGFKHPDWLPREHFYTLARLATARAQQGKFDQALGSIRTLEKMSPQNPYPHYLHAVVAYRQGHLDDATSELQQVLKVQPNNVKAQLLMGAVNYAQGNYAQAEMYLSNVMGMDQKNVHARKLLALTFYREGRSHQALDTLRPVAGNHLSDPQLLAILQKAATEGAGKNGPASAAAAIDNPTDARFAKAGRAIANGHEAQAIRLLKEMPTGDASSEARRNTLLVMAYLSEKRPDEAVKVAAAYAAKNQDKSNAHLLYGTALVAADKRAEAHTQFATAHTLNPKDVAALLSLGSLDALEGRYKNAAGRYQAALKQEPHNATALTALGRLDMLRGDKAEAMKHFKQAIDAAPKSPSAYLGLLILYSESGQMDKASSTAKELAKANPHNPAALNALGTTELNAGHRDEALASLQQAVNLAPDIPLYRTNLARAQVLDKDTKHAKDNLLKVIKTDPSQVTAVTLLAFMKLQDHDLAGAIALAQRLQKQTATRAAGFGLEGDLYMADKSWSKAATAYQHGLKIHYDRRFVLRNFLALSRSGAKHPENGLRDWLDKHPDDAASRLLLGQYYLDHAQNTPAAHQYEKVLDAYPSNVAALNNLAWIYVTQHNPKALALAEKAYKLAPDSPGIADTYGWALIAANKPASALSILTKAAKAASKVPAIQYHLAVAQARNGDKAAARVTLAALQKSGVDFPDRQAAQKLYHELGGAAEGSGGN